MELDQNSNERHINMNIEDIVKRSYEQVKDSASVKNIDGAQMWQGQWWMPLWGCDTLDHLVDALNEAQKANISEVCRNLGCQENNK